MTGLLAAGTTVEYASFASLAIVIVGFIAAMFGGFFSWRSKQGEFYKELAQERKDQIEALQKELEQRRLMTDISPITKTLEGVTKALENHTQLTEQVFDKVADMNGSLRHTASAMQALGDRLVLDEAARALLATAAERKDT